MSHIFFLLYCLTMLYVRHAEIIYTVAGTGSSGYSDDGGVATLARLNNPAVLSTSPSVPTIYPSSNPASVAIISNVAGDGVAQYSGDNNFATSASLNFPWGVAVDQYFNIYIADLGNNRVRKVTASTGIITTIAGTGTAGYSGDGEMATAATINSPSAISFDSSGNIYVCERGNHVIRIIKSDNVIQTFCGTGSPGYNSDSIACTSALLNYPTVIRHDSSNNLYLSDWENFRVRKIDTSNIITTIAGDGNVGIGSVGDGGPATSASFWYPAGVYPAASGKIYIADIVNNNIRVVSSTGTITTIAGSTSQQSGSSGDNSPASSALFTSPYDCCVDNSGDYMFVSDRDNDRIRKINLVTGIITTVVGTGYYSCDDATGIATSIGLCEPMGLAIDPANNIYIVNNQGHRIKKVNFDGSFSPSNSPSTSPTLYPSCSPTVLPTAIPTESPTYAPTVIPSNVPTTIPSAAPTTVEPTTIPSMMPSQTPTSTPTSTPIAIDAININMLSVPLNDKAVRAKTKYYLGTFIVYFLCIYVLLYLYSFYGYGYIQASSLYHSARKAEVYRQRSKSNLASEYRGALHEIHAKNKIIEALDAEETARGNSIEDSMNGYSKTFREYFKQQRCILGCDSIIHPKGYTRAIPIIGMKIELPPGRYETFLLYLFHNHPLLSCFYFMQGSKLGAHGTRILYIGKDIVMFAGYQFSGMLLQYYGLDNYGLNAFINLFVITPMAISVGSLLVFLYSCPFTETTDFQRRYAKYQSLVLFLGRLAIIPLILLMCASLFLACIFSTGRKIPLIILRYFFMVQVYGFFLWIAKAVLIFNDSYYYRLSIFGKIHLITIGNLCCENIVHHNLVEGQDFVHVISNYGVFAVQRILLREDAIKAGLIVVNFEKVTDVELAVNPMYRARLAAPLQEDIAVSNIVSSSNSDSNSVDNSSVIKLQEVEQQCSICNIYIKDEGQSIGASAFEQVILRHALEHDNAVRTIAETEDSLLREYQEALATGIDGSGNHYNFDEGTLSFEEWKMKRKQFKQGTRGSFVKAFQVFEEREQARVVGEGSVIHTMHLVGPNVVNPLNYKKKK